MFNLSRLAPLAIAFALCSGSVAFAGSANTTMTATAEVTQLCNNLSATNLDFGKITSFTTGQVNGSGTLNYTCTNGTNAILQANDGQGGGADCWMNNPNGGPTLVYDLSMINNLGSGGTQLNCNNSNSFAMPTANGAPQAITVYGDLQAGNPYSGVVFGTYQDTVTLTMTF